MTGVGLPMHEFLREASGRIPNLAGIKFTHADLDHFASCVNFDNGRFDILFGRGEKLLDGLEHGAKGAVGSTYNFAANLYLSIIQHYRSGNIVTARQLQARAVAIIDAIHASGCGTGSLKAAMNRYVLGCGPARLPLRNPPMTDRMPPIQC